MSYRNLSPILLLLVVLLICIAFSFLRSVGTISVLAIPGGSETPEEAVRRAACGADTAPTEFEVYETYRAGEGEQRVATVVFRADCPIAPGENGGTEFAGIEDVRRDWFSWRLFTNETALAYSRSIFPRSDQGSGLLAFSVGTGQGMASGPFAFTGVRVLAPGAVGFVEGTFDNGETVRRQIGAGTTATIIQSLGAKHVCEVRAIDRSGRVLRSYDAAAADGDPTVDAHEACEDGRR